MRSVVVDANVFVSYFIDRHEAQRTAARALLQSQYGVTAAKLLSGYW